MTDPRSGGGGEMILTNLAPPKCSVCGGEYDRRTMQHVCTTMRLPVSIVVDAFGNVEEIIP